MAPWTSLPHALVRKVLGFTLDDSDFPPWPRVAPDVGDPTARLPPSLDNGARRYEASLAFATVCRDWHAVVLDAASTRALQTLIVDVHCRPSRSSALALRNNFLLRRARLQIVRVLAPSSFGPDDAQRHWKAVFSHAPQLVELEVSASPLHPLGGVVSIIRAVTEHCPRLQKLLLPTFNPYAMNGPSSNFVPYRQRSMVFSRDRDLSDFVRAVYACIKATFVTTHGVGLTSLRLPLGPFTRNPVANADDYLDLVARCCPNMQLLNGYRDFVVNYDPVFCREQWMIGLDAWRRFCSTCVQLTEFSWMCVPFATVYFNIFGETIKPQLRKLEIVAPKWDWERFKATVDIKTYAIVQETGCVAATKNVHTILRASPRLQELRVIWTYDMGATSPATMNAEVFGDDFCAALALHCKDLRMLMIASIPGRVEPSVSIQQFTDKSMQSLATLPQLHEVSLGGCNITGDGLFELVFCHAAETRQERVYRIQLGDCWQGRTSATARTFYTSLLRFLELLSGGGEGLPCGSHHISLIFQNGNIHDMEGPASVQYLTKVRELAARVRQRHPRVVMRSILEGYNGGDGSFQTITRFELSTNQFSRDALESDDSDSECRDDSIDDVFVSRTYLE